jgi:Zn-dependent oligopeptidase
LRATLAEMAPIVAQSSELRRAHTEIAAALDAYKSQLRELQQLLVQIRVVLQTRQAKLNLSKSHTAAVAGWVSAFHLTR